MMHRAALGFLLAVLLITASSAAQKPSPGRPVVALLTDFGLAGDAVGLCHGAILAVNRDIAIVDLAHNIPAFNIQQAALALARTEIFPAGTVFVAVVDPGVGTRRRAVGIRTAAGMVYLGPDNGVLTNVLQRHSVVEACELDPAKINPAWRPGTFDGRDLFSPAGALIATAGGDFAAFGQPIDPATLLRLPIPALRVDAAHKTIHGAYIATDHPYGNVWTNISAEALTQIGVARGERLVVTIGATRLELDLAGTFGDVPEDAPLAYLNSDNFLALAVNKGDFAARYALSVGMDVQVAKAVADRPAQP